MMMGKVQIYRCLQFASEINPMLGKKASLFLSPFHNSTDWFLILAEAFWNDHGAACSTVLRSATEKNEMGGHVTAPCSSEMTQRIGTAFCFSSSDVTSLVTTETNTEQLFTFKVTLSTYSDKSYCKIVETVNLELNYSTSQFKRVNLYNI